MRQIFFENEIADVAWDRGWDALRLEKRLFKKLKWNAKLWQSFHEEVEMRVDTKESNSEKLDPLLETFIKRHITGFESGSYEDRMELEQEFLDIRGYPEWFCAHTESCEHRSLKFSVIFTSIFFENEFKKLERTFSDSHPDLKIESWTLEEFLN